MNASHYFQLSLVCWKYICVRRLLGGLPQLVIGDGRGGGGGVEGGGGEGCFYCC